MPKINKMTSGLPRVDFTVGAGSDFWRWMGFSSRCVVALALCVELLWCVALSLNTARAELGYFSGCFPAMEQSQHHHLCWRWQSLGCSHAKRFDRTTEPDSLLWHLNSLWTLQSCLLSVSSDGRGGGGGDGGGNYSMSAPWGQKRWMYVSVRRLPSTAGYPAPLLQVWELPWDQQLKCWVWGYFYCEGGFKILCSGGVIEDSLS